MAKKLNKILISFAKIAFAIMKITNKLCNDRKITFKLRHNLKQTNDALIQTE